jgi:hypothetical protein
MTVYKSLNVICDYCKKEENNFHNLTEGQILRILEPRGWKYYEDTRKHYCSRTCSANDRKRIYDNNNQIRTES